LTDLAVQHHVAPATQNQAFSDLLFLYNEVLQPPLDRPINARRAKQPANLPTVLTWDEVQAVLRAMTDGHQMMAKLLYGSGVRVMECVRLRVKDSDFSYQPITVRNGTGAKDRVTMLANRLIAPLQEQLQRVKLIHAQDLRAGYGHVDLPDAVERTYPHASREWIWQ
jgi:integrase